MSGRRIAILIGNAAFPHEQKKLPDLACPLNDVDGLAEQLEHPDRGGFEIVKQVKDKDNGEIRREIATFIRQADPQDTVLFYYSGHGKLDDNFALHLCANDSEVDVLEATAISIDFVWDLLGKCKAKRSIVLLDCCFSGAAAGVRARGNVEDALKVRASGAGTYLLTASDAIETAQEKEEDKYGVFTKHLIAGLESGEADRDGNGVVTMDDMYNYICRSVRADSPQKPTRQVGGHGNIVIAKSGKDPRKDRAEEVKLTLFTKVASGDLDSKIAARAEKIARMLPSQMSPSEKQVDEAISDLLAKRIDFGKFVTRYHKVSSEARTRAPDPEPKPKPDSVPEAEPPPKARKKQSIWGIAKPFTVGKPKTTVKTEPGTEQPGDEADLYTGLSGHWQKFQNRSLPADKDEANYEGFTGWWLKMQDRSLLGKSRLYLNYGAPILMLIAASIFSSTLMEMVNYSEQSTVLSLVGAGLMAVIVMHMKANKQRLSIGGMVVNGLVCGIGALLVLAGIVEL